MYGKSKTKRTVTLSQNHTHIFVSEQENLQSFKIDGWMIYDFTFFSTVFQSYQDGVCVCGGG